MNEPSITEQTMHALKEEWTAPLKHALTLLADQCTELEGANRVLATAIRDIEAEAQDNLDLGRDDLNRLIHICQTGGVRAALEAS